MNLKKLCELLFITIACASSAWAEYIDEDTPIIRGNTVYIPEAPVKLHALIIAELEKQNVPLIILRDPKEGDKPDYLLFCELGGYSGGPPKPLISGMQIIQTEPWKLLWASETDDAPCNVCITSKMNIYNDDDAMKKAIEIQVKRLKELIWYNREDRAPSASPAGARGSTYNTIDSHSGRFVQKRCFLTSYFEKAAVGQ